MMRPCARQVSRRSPVFAALGLSVLLLGGCVSPERRAREKPAALRQLSPADQRLVLSGRIREGFGKDAVYIAWSAPTHVFTVHPRGESFDSWFYTRVERGVAGGYFGVSRGFTYTTGRGRARRYNDAPDDFYIAPPYQRAFPPPETEVPYKKAIFQADRVIGFESLQGE